MVSVLGGKHKFEKVGRHPASAKYSTRITIDELLNRELHIQNGELIRIFFDRGQPSFLISTKGNHALLIAMNAHHRWEIADMIDRAA